MVGRKVNSETWCLSLKCNCSASGKKKEKKLKKVQQEVINGLSKTQVEEDVTTLKPVTTSKIPDTTVSVQHLNSLVNSSISSMQLIV